MNKDKPIIYLIADIFAPAFAPRAVAFVKNLSYMGYELIVFTEKQSNHLLFEGYKDICKVYRIELNSKNKYIRKLEQLAELIYEYKERLFYKKILSIIKEESLPKPNIILSMSYRKFPFTASMLLKNRLSVPIVLDIRDMIEQFDSFLPKKIQFCSIKLGFLEKIIRPIYISRRNNAIHQADYITTISNWHKDLLESISKKNNVDIIYNGYDADIFRTHEVISPDFEIVFTGRLISKELRDPSLIIDIAKELESEIKELKLKFYVDEVSKNIIRDIEKDYGFRANIYEMIPISEIVNILNRASILLLISNSEAENGAKGMISTKIFEAMALQKHTILFPDNSSEASEIIRKANIGIASNNKEEIKNFISKAYQDWKKKHYIVKNDANKNYIANFDRANSSKYLEKIIRRLIDDKRYK